MKEYLFSVAGISMIAALVSILLPQGKMQKFISGMMRFICLAVIILPIGNRMITDDFTTGDEGINFQENYLSECESILEEEAEKEINRLIWDKIHITVTSSVLMNGIQIEKIYIFFQGEGISFGEWNIDIISQITQLLEEKYRAEIIYESMD